MHTREGPVLDRPRARRHALGAGEAAAGLEVDLDVQPLIVGVEFGVRHHPRRYQAESEKNSEGAIANMLGRTVKPFAECAEKIVETVRNSPVIASDETSARVRGKTYWQWTFVAAKVVVHLIAPTRGSIVPSVCPNAIPI